VNKIQDLLQGLCSKDKNIIFKSIEELTKLDDEGDNIVENLITQYFLTLSQSEKKEMILDLMKAFEITAEKANCRNNFIKDIMIELKLSRLFDILLNPTYIQGMSKDFVQALSSTEEKIIDISLKALARIPQETQEQITVILDEFDNIYKKLGSYYRLKLLLIEMCSDNKEVQQILFQRYNKSTESLKILYTQVFSELGKEAEPIIEELLLCASRDDDSDEKAAALRAIGKISPDNERVLEILLSNSKHPAYWVRKNVLDGLGEFHSSLDRILPVLVDALDDEDGCDGFVSDHAIKALGKIGPSAISTLPILFKKFKEQILAGENRWIETEGVIRYINAVGSMGKDAKETLEKMNELLKEHYYDEELLEYPLPNERIIKEMEEYLYKLS